MCDRYVWEEPRWLLYTISPNAIRDLCACRAASWNNVFKVSYATRISADSPTVTNGNACELHRKVKNARKSRNVRVDCIVSTGDVQRTNRRTYGATAVVSTTDVESIRSVKIVMAHGRKSAIGSCIDSGKYWCNKSLIRCTLKIFRKNLIKCKKGFKWQHLNSKFQVLEKNKKILWLLENCGKPFGTFLQYLYPPRKSFPVH